MKPPNGAGNIRFGVDAGTKLLLSCIALRNLDKPTIIPPSARGLMPFFRQGGLADAVIESEVEKDHNIQ
jgi:hypothetical protein